MNIRCDPAKAAVTVDLQFSAIIRRPHVVTLILMSEAIRPWMVAFKEITPIDRNDPKNKFQNGYLKFSV